MTPEEPAPTHFQTSSAHPLHHTNSKSSLPQHFRKLLYFILGFASLITIIYNLIEIRSYLATQPQHKPTIDMRAHISITPTLISTPTLTLTPTTTPTPTPTVTMHPTPKPTRVPTPEANYINAYATYYGWSDNSPPGGAIAYPKNSQHSTYHTSAGGSGTFDDPVTFAAASGSLAIGTKIYLPYIKKYAVLEDLCASCSNGSKIHIDIWMDSNGSFEEQLYACQRQWTRETIQVELNPPAGRAINSASLFNPQTGECASSR